MNKITILAMIFSLSFPLLAYKNTYCVWIYCQNNKATILKNANNNPIVRTAEFTGPHYLSGDYFINKYAFDTLADECARLNTPVINGVLYGKNAEAPLSAAFMWELRPADQAARNRPNFPPSLVEIDARCQALEK